MFIMFSWMAGPGHERQGVRHRMVGA